MNKIKGLIYGIAIFVIIIAINFWGVLALKKPVNIEDLLKDGSDLKNKSVYIDIDAVVENYAIMERTTNGIKSSDTRYYMVWTESDKFLGVRVSKKNYDIMEEILVKTYEYFDEKGDLADPLRLEGIIKPMDKEESGYYTESLDYHGINDERAIFYTIDATVSRKTKIMILGIVDGIILLVLLIVIISNSKKKMKPNMYQTTVVNNGPDLYNSTNINNVSDLNNYNDSGNSNDLN